MLDLTNRTNTKKLYEIKMVDGQVLQLRLPTQGLLMKLVKIQNMTKTNDPIELLEELTNLTTAILNLNINGKTYTNEDVGNMLDLPTQMLIIQDYFTTITKTLGE